MVCQNATLGYHEDILNFYVTFLNSNYDFGFDFIKIWYENFNSSRKKDFISNQLSTF